MRKTLALLAALASVSAASGFEKVASGEKGDRYVDRAARMILDVPSGFVRVEPKKNPDVAYQFACRLAKPRFEIRVAFSPMTETPERRKEREGCEKGGTCVMADLDKPSDVWGQAVQGNLTDDSDVKFFPFPPEGVKKEFAGDWGYVSSPFEMTGKHTFNDEGFKYGQMVVVHRNGAGTFYRIALGDDVEALHELDHRLFYSARFDGAQPPGADKPDSIPPKK